MVRLLVGEGEQAPVVREPWKPTDDGIRSFAFADRPDWNICNVEEGDTVLALTEQEGAYSWQRAAELTALPEFNGRVHVFVLKGKRPVADASFLDKSTAKRPCTQKERALHEYRPSFVQRDVLFGHSEPVIVSLRWLQLLVDFGTKVDIQELNEARAIRAQADPKAKEVPEKLYYPGVLAFLRAASYGQEQLYYGRQGLIRNVVRSDLQGLIRRMSEGRHVQRAPSEVKVKVAPSTEKDPHGVAANALILKQEADYLRSGIELTADAVRMGCLFCRMDRFWVVQYDRVPRTVRVTPYFPHSQSVLLTPDQYAVSDPEFVLMDLRRVAEAECLSDALPRKPTAGFATLVAFHEQLQRLFELPRAHVSFVPVFSCSSCVPFPSLDVSDLAIVAHGRKSLVVLRRSSVSVLKICLEEYANTDLRIHMTVDGHPNLRRLVHYGQVNIGYCSGVFRFLELEGFGKPFGAEHVANLAATEAMWQQAAQGLDHLHQKGVFHRDLKPDNMLVFEGSVLKINDYDVSCFKSDDDELRNLAGTRGFQSPSARLPYREQNDVLSLGLAFYAAKTGIVSTSVEARLHILRHELHPHVFPENMRVAVQRALKELNLDQEAGKKRERSQKKKDGAAARL